MFITLSNQLVVWANNLASFQFPRSLHKKTYAARNQKLRFFENKFFVRPSIMGYAAFLWLDPPNRQGAGPIRKPTLRYRRTIEHLATESPSAPWMPTLKARENRRFSTHFFLGISHPLRWPSGWWRSTIST